MSMAFDTGIRKYITWAYRDNEESQYCPFERPGDFDLIMTWAAQPQRRNTCLHLGVFYKDQCNLEINPAQLLALANNGVVLCPSIYRDD